MQGYFWTTGKEVKFVREREEVVVKKLITMIQDRTGTGERS